LVIENDSLRVLADQCGGAWYLTFRHRAPGGDWRTVLSTGMDALGSGVPQGDDGIVLDPLVEWLAHEEVQSETGLCKNAELSDDGKEIVLRGAAGFWAEDRPIIEVIQRVSLTEETVRVRVTHRTRTSCGEAGLAKLMSCFFFLPDGIGRNVAEPLEFAWLPALHRETDDVVGDHVFRSPATVVQANGLYAALVPDLGLLGEARQTIRHAMDLHRAGWHNSGEPHPAGRAPRLYYGFCTWQPYWHVYYKHRRDDLVTLRPGDLSYGFDLFLGRSDGPEEVCRRVHDHLWQRYGLGHLADGRPQVLPLEEYGRKYAYVYELPKTMRRVTIDGKACAGIDNPGRRGSNFHAWENDLLMGFGMRHYADRWGDRELRGIADGIRQLLLRSPRKDGAFHCVYNFKEEQFEGSLPWTARVGDPLEGYDAAAMGVTAWWMLYWSEHFGEDEAFADWVTAYAHFLADQQLPSGAVPTYFFADLTPARQLREAGTTAISGAVLAKAAALTGDATLKEAALAAGRFVDEQVVTTLRFYDFETFYSCSPKPITWIDPLSGLPPQNNLCVQWAADQFLALHRLTGDAHWLRRGRYALDLLSFYHQVWSPPWYIGCLFGGFGVMNTDGEWNDGRQARFVHTYADYYEATGDIEQLERAVAACRASFALMDIEENHANAINFTNLGQGAGSWIGRAPENVYHGGPSDCIGGWSGFNWSAGGGLTASAYLQRKFGDVWVDGERKQAVGIDGVNASVSSWEGANVSVDVTSTLATLASPVAGPREVLVKFGRIGHGPYAVTINDQSFGEVSVQELAEGLTVPLS